MEIKMFSKYSLPDQFVFAGNDYLYMMKKDKKEFIQSGMVYNISLNMENNKNHNENELSDIRKTLMSKPTGIVLNSSFFVFNILKFEKIPFNKKKLEEIVNWRITRIFPEDQNLYIHQYYILNSEYILSVLLRKEVKKTIDAFFYKTGIKQSYCGSSTIELINLMYSSINPIKKLINPKKTPDFFIELWGNSATIVFQNKLTPFYIRKFNFIDEKELSSEIDKTINFINNSYNISPKTYSLFKNNYKINDEDIEKKLNEIKLVKINIGNSITRFIAGVSL